MAFLKRLATYGVLAAIVQALAGLSAEAKTLKLVALGDSLTAGYGVKPGARFPEVLEKALKAKGYDVAVFNAGVSGDTAGDGLARYDWSVPPDADALIIELGANDMLRGLSVESARKSLAAMLAKARDARLPTLLAGMKAAPNLGSEYREAFDRIYPELAAEYGAILYPFFLDGVAADPKTNQPDGLHPSASGVKIIVEKMLPSVEALLGKAKS